MRWTEGPTEGVDVKDDGKTDEEGVEKSTETGTGMVSHSNHTGPVSGD